MESNQDDVIVQFRQQVYAAWDAIAERFPGNTPRHVIKELRLQFLIMIEDEPTEVFVMSEIRTPTMHRVFTRLRPHIATAFERMAIELQQPRFAVRPRMPSDREVSRVPRGILAAIATGRMDYLQ